MLFAFGYKKAYRHDDRVQSYHRNLYQLSSRVNQNRVVHRRYSSEAASLGRNAGQSSRRTARSQYQYCRRALGSRTSIVRASQS
jgi:hypothetical protein